MRRHHRANDADAGSEGDGGERHAQAEQVGHLHVIARQRSARRRKGTRYGNRDIDGEHARRRIAAEQVVEAKRCAQPLRRRGETSAHVPLSAARGICTKQAAVVTLAVARADRGAGHLGKGAQGLEGRPLALMLADGPHHGRGFLTQIMLHEHKAIERTLRRLEGVHLLWGQLALVAARPKQACRAEPAQVDVVRGGDWAHALGTGIHQRAGSEALEITRALAPAAIHDLIERIGIRGADHAVEDVANGQERAGVAPLL